MNRFIRSLTGVFTYLLLWHNFTIKRNLAIYGLQFAILDVDLAILRQRKASENSREKYEKNNNNKKNTNYYFFIC